MTEISGDIIDRGMIAIDAKIFQKSFENFRIMK